ncbi:hypothetical protein PG993_009577 [Apiospora rasikravindrae]|uniref:FAD-binding FR-type domain-containing protein n=1 Tax=Apiospora rasikravindrae TaxID=990691 RepID=A0ABR1SK72_9PEZI
MQLKQESGAPTDSIPTTDKMDQRNEFTKQSSSLPFGQPVALSSISGPTYVTSQLLTFDLDVAVKSWSENNDKNIHGYSTSVVPLQTRTGAGAFALGYIFSKDFDLSKRHIPQTLLAPSLSLRNLRSSLDQLALLYGVASPFVAHIAAADYSSNSGLVPEYGSAMQLAEELGLGLVSSSSAYEAQHMSLFATLMAKVIPTLHIYDGVRTSRETTRVIDALSETGVSTIYNTVAAAADALNQRLDSAGKYSGHKEAETVVVVFGSVESQLAKQVVQSLSDKGFKIGAVSVRVYRPFVEEAFLKVLPASASGIIVLGQVHDASAVSDASVQSTLYSDVFTSVSFTDKWTSAPTVIDAKYAAADAFTPSSFTGSILKAIGKEAPVEKTQLPQLENVGQYVFWDVDDSVSLNAPMVVGNLLSRDSSHNVFVNETHDNLVQGGVVRTDVRSSKKSIDAPYAIEEADVVFVGDEKLLKEVATSQTVKSGGKLVLKLPNFKDEDVDKRVPEAVRKDIQARGIELHILDSAPSSAFEHDKNVARLLVDLAFLRVARPDLKSETLQQLATQEGNTVALQECNDALDKCLIKFEVPESWAEIAGEASASLPATSKSSSFVPFEKQDVEQDIRTSTWTSAAKGLLFKEAYGTEISLRPEQTVKTYTISVKENRRLTPATYDRNIFHIEFDLGDSGLTYKIGEALGIHADNDPELVQEFIESYGLNGDELVQVPGRDGDFMETRTVFQSLMQNIDIFGKPPKRFYESLAEFASDEMEKKRLQSLGSSDGADEFKKRNEVDTLTYADILEEFRSAKLSFTDMVRLVGPLKRREYSIASAQAVTPNAVALMIVVVNWVDTKGRDRYGQATRYLSRLPAGSTITASVKPSVMKLPTRDDAPLIMAGLGTGLAPFRAFVQYRAMQKAQGKEIGEILLYLGSRHQREEYLYGEEWEAYVDAGVITILGAAFSRDQPQKIYIQDRMRQTINNIVKAYITNEGSFYLCGPTWPVPDVTEVLQEAIETEARTSGKKVDSKKEIDRLKEEGRYVLEVY